MTSSTAMIIPLSPSDVLNHQARVGEARLALDMALSHGTCPMVTTKFSPDSSVFLHFVTQLAPRIPVVWIETGYESQATRSFAERTSRSLNLNLEVFRANDHVLRAPPALDDPDHLAFTEEVKLIPFQRALDTLDPDIWLSSIRRYQSELRRKASTFQTLETGLLKVSPLLGWSRDDVSRYALTHALEIGPDAFDPTKGEPFRECGLHRHLGA